MMKEVRSDITKDAESLGLSITDVRIRRTDLTKEVSQQTYDRMKAERLAEAALLRARGQEQAQTLKAIADRQAVEIVAGARRDSEILRGEGDATRSQVFADAYSKDPDFFQFYRSMQAYSTALGPNGTTMVLSPDSEFFEYFGADGNNGGSSALPGGTVPPMPPVAPTATPATEVAPATPAEPAATPAEPTETPAAEPTTTPTTDATPAPAAGEPAAEAPVAQ